MSTLKYWIWLTTRPGLSHTAAARVLEYFGSPEAAYFADPAEYELAQLTPGHQSVLRDKSLAQAEDILASCDRLGLRVLTLQDADYPERLRQIPAPPGVLYLRGRWFSFDEEVAIGVVGTRRPTPYGVEMAGTLGLELAQGGALVVSGIAQGLDSAALKGALQGGGGVVSVLGCGVDVVYPAENRWLYEDVAAAGALVSEFPPGSPPEGWHFPVRNRIISGLSLGVAAVEAAERSGTLITARLALEQNRDVFALPGPANAPMSMGTNGLIQRGEAKLILSAQDILCEYQGVYPGRLRPAGAPGGAHPIQAQRDRPEAARQKEVDKVPKRAYISQKDYDELLTDDERALLSALEGQCLYPDELAERTQLPAHRILSALTMLQVQGYVTEAAGKRFSAAVALAPEQGTEAAGGAEEARVNTPLEV